MKSLMVLFRGVGADDEVLDGLVQGMAHVDVAVGEGRAVVEGEAGMAFVLLQQLVIKIQFLPLFQHVRLPLGQAGTHGEIGFRQIQRSIKVL